MVKLICAIHAGLVGEKLFNMKHVAFIILITSTLACGSPNYGMATLPDGSSAVVVECKTEFQCIKRINIFCHTGYRVVEESANGTKMTKIVKCSTLDQK